ncbi:MAG: NUDIX domain-containing protein [Planctomycetaceae bacterium]|nr:NUDIX domain-containing protein [Planctomycetaceae bacterium]
MKTPRSCGFLIVKGDPIHSFLLMKHPNRWDLPKGHVDPGETDLECALRELEEETGIGADDIEIMNDFLFENRYVVSGKRYDLGEGSVEKTLRIFMGRLLRDVDLLLTEHDSYHWFPWQPPHNVQEKTINPLLASVEDYLQNR